MTDLDTLARTIALQRGVGPLTWSAMDECERMYYRREAEKVMKDTVIIEPIPIREPTEEEIECWAAGLIRRRLMTKAELLEKFPDAKLPADLSAPLDKDV